MGAQLANIKEGDQSTLTTFRELIGTVVSQRS